MRIDGQEIAKSMYSDLKRRVGELSKKNITPHLVVFLVGKNPASVAYVTLKQKKGEEIGAKVTVMNFDTSVTIGELVEKLKLLNTDPYVHGILIQRPLPEHIDLEKIVEATSFAKDLDGFHTKSPYTLPLPLSVVKILEEVYSNSNTQSEVVWGNARTDSARFLKWLNSKNIVLLGKGPTGGGPILEYLKTLGITPKLIDSKTINSEKLMKKADIIISAVGRRVINPQNLKKGVILISVGIFKGEDNKLKGDYDQNQIENIASFYTPTPGGVGPVNVAKLMENLVTAAEIQSV